MIFDAKTIPFIVAGTTTTTILPASRKQLPRKHRTYAVRKRIPALRDDDGHPIRRAQIKTTAHRLRILDVTPHPDGWLITFELDKRAVQERPRLLHKNSMKGYTSNPAEAVPHEPEAIDRWTIAAFTTEAHERHAQRDLQQQQRTLTERLQTLLDAQTQGIDVSRQLASIRQRIEAGERKLHRAA